VTFDENNTFKIFHAPQNLFEMYTPHQIYKQIKMLQKPLFASLIVYTFGIKIVHAAKQKYLNQTLILVVVWTLDSCNPAISSQILSSNANFKRL
jgi:hypothetical protein